MLKFFKRLVKEEEGQTLVEYGMIIALVAVFVIMAVTMFGEALHAWFEALADWIDSSFLDSPQ